MGEGWTRLPRKRRAGPDITEASSKALPRCSGSGLAKRAAEGRNSAHVLQELRISGPGDRRESPHALAGAG
jgi:hypothetical protein